MDDFGYINELNNDFNNLSSNFNDLRNSLSPQQNDANISNAFSAGELNGLQGFEFISRQYQSLILLLIILYWWSNQAATNYFMNANGQMMNNMSCLLEKLVDNSTSGCPTSGLAPAAIEPAKKRHKHHKCCSCCADCC